MTVTGSIMMRAIVAPMSILTSSVTCGRVPQPFDYEGAFYRVRQAYSDVKPLQQPYIPLYFGGASTPAIQVAARHCDVYALWGEPVAAVKERIAVVCKAAQVFGRTPRFSVSFRPILGRTEAPGLGTRPHHFGPGPGRQSSYLATSGRWLSTPTGLRDPGELHDKRLWMPIAAATGAAGNTSALVGTPEQVAEALLDYCDAGVTTLLIRGFAPFQDAIDYGRELIPLVRAELAQRRAVAGRF